MPPSTLSSKAAAAGARHFEPLPYFGRGSGLRLGRTSWAFRPRRSSWATARRKYSTSWCGFSSAPVTRRSSRRRPTHSSRPRPRIHGGVPKAVPLTALVGTERSRGAARGDDRADEDDLPMQPEQPDRQGLVRRDLLVRVLEAGLPVDGRPGISGVWDVDRSHRSSSATRISSSTRTLSKGFGLAGLRVGYDRAIPGDRHHTAGTDSVQR